MNDMYFSKVYPTWIIAYCPDANSFFITNQRHFFWEYNSEFKSEEEAIVYFKSYLKKFLDLRNGILKSTGGWSLQSDLYLENTNERFSI